MAAIRLKHCLCPSLGHYYHFTSQSLPSSVAGWVFLLFASSGSLNQRSLTPWKLQYVVAHLSYYQPILSAARSVLLFTQLKGAVTRATFCEST